MDFFAVVDARRSVRKFQPQPFEEDKLQRALAAAVLAPNSSNTQTWDFYWAREGSIKDTIAQHCLSQSAARTASDLVVVVADPGLWRRSQPRLVEYVQSVKAPKPVVVYYQKLVPLMYRWGLFNVLAPVKWLLFNGAGLVRPTMRGPNSRRDSQEVAIKSAALAAENFVLAITAQGGATCMMEGFDECRLRRLLKLSSSARIVMVIAVGYAAENGTWGPRFRLPLEDVVHRL